MIETARLRLRLLTIEEAQAMTTGVRLETCRRPSRPGVLRCDLAHRRRAHVHYLVGDDPHCLEAETLRRLVPDAADRDVYLSGPPPMAAAVRAALRQLGLPPRQLHEERFAW